MLFRGVILPVLTQQLNYLQAVLHVLPTLCTSAPQLPFLRQIDLHITCCTQALLASSGWADTSSTRTSPEEGQDEEEDLRPGPWLRKLLGMDGSTSPLRQSMRVQGIALIATKTILDGKA